LLTRRQFVHSSALLLGLPSLGALANSWLPVIKPRFLIEAGVPDAQSFLAQCPDTGPCVSIANGLNEFDTILADTTTNAIFGLSRDSTYVLCRQVALSSGFSTAYLGEHDARGDSVRHTLRGSEASVSALQRSLSKEQTWTRALGLTLPTVALSADLTALVQATSNGSSTRGYWVSWLLRRA
jgi:hypothetical protein